MLRIPLFLPCKALRARRATLATEPDARVEGFCTPGSCSSEGAVMPRKQYEIRVTSTVRDNIDPHQIANILLDWYELS